MSDNLNPNLDRRTFLRGATTVIGASALAQSGLVSAVATEGVISVAFVDGERLIPAQWLVKSSVPMEKVEIKVTGRGKGELTSLKANFLVRFQTTARRYPFFAWVAGGGRGHFEMPVDKKTGLNFTLSQGKGKSEATTELQLGSTTGGFVLREGTYLIAAGKVDWKGLRMESGAIVGAGGQPVNLQYVRLSIARA